MWYAKIDFKPRNETGRGKTLFQNNIFYFSFKSLKAVKFNKKRLCHKLNAMQSSIKTRRVHTKLDKEMI